MSESVLLVGGGGREHALALAMAASPELDRVYCAPGNAGTAQMEKAVNMEFGPGDVDSILSFAVAKREDEREDMVVVLGPEAPIVAGVADRLRAEYTPVFGPDAAAGRLEGSKVFACEFMQRHGIAMPESWVVRSMEGAMQTLGGRLPTDIVLKADGLASGKGVVLPDSDMEMRETLDAMLSGRGYDGAGVEGVVIQERLSGPEVSVFAISDGRTYSIVPFIAQDHKRLADGDKGPNTGGMGAYAPVPAEMVSQRQREQIAEVVDLTLGGIRQEGAPYKGVLFVNFMLAEQRGGAPVVIEYNARFGDPEAQVLMSLLVSDGVDVYTLLRDTAYGCTSDLGELQFAGRAALSVCLAAEGYPDNPVPGKIIRGLDREYPGVTVHHGATQQYDGHVLTAGGRVLYVTGEGETVDEAAQAAYAAIGPEGVHFKGMHYRKDIGRQALLGNEQL